VRYLKNTKPLNTPKQKLVKIKKFLLQSCRNWSNSANPKQTRCHGSRAFEIQQPQCAMRSCLQP